jgi:hypothetical protein
MEPDYCDHVKTIALEQKKPHVTDVSKMVSEAECRWNTDNVNGNPACHNLDSEWYTMACSCTCSKRCGSPEPAGEVCEWIRDGFYYLTSCGKDFQSVSECSITENLTFCPYCGKPIAEMGVE